MERSFKGDDLHPFGRAFVIPVFARHFDGQLAAFGSRIGEKYSVRKGKFNKFVGQFLLLCDVVKVGHMPKHLRLITEPFDQGRMRMTKRIHRNTGSKIKETSPVCLNQPASFAFDKIQRGTGVCR